jgi:hypothetical protein
MNKFIYLREFSYFKNFRLIYSVLDVCNISSICKLIINAHIDIFTIINNKLKQVMRFQ